MITTDELNKLSKLAYKNAKAHGFHDKEYSDDKEKAIEDLGKAVFYMRDEFKTLHFE